MLKTRVPVYLNFINDFMSLRSIALNKYVFWIATDVCEELDLELTTMIYSVAVARVDNIKMKY
jgi:hypothetical protein